MAFKPFRPPLLNKPGNDQVSSAARLPSEGEGYTLPPPQKKRRLTPGNEIDHGRFTTSKSQSQFKRPLLQSPTISLDSKISASTGNSGQNHESISSREGRKDTVYYYNVLWRKFTAKKHKTWDGDGVLWIRDGYAYLQDLSGRDLGRIACNGPLELGAVLSIASKEVEIESTLSKPDYLAGKPFLENSKKSSVVQPLQPSNNDLTLSKSSLLANRDKPQHTKTSESQKLAKVDLPRTKAAQAHFKNPLLEKTTLEKSNTENPIPRHDPTKPGALIMKRPKHVNKGKQVVDVVVDPTLSRHLRQHQREGVTFLYECVMGMRPHNGEGAILADEMGLGKTLQVITLLWTLLKQNPIHNDPPVIKKALIVCPVTLIKNWRKEFRKWLGNERIGVFILDDKKSRLTDFTMGKSYNILIVGYEKLRTIQEDLQKGPGIDIVIADEGHRLKSAQNKSAQAIKSLNTEKRIILSGTPLQNDLSEFYFMVDFVNPGVLGKSGTFKREFENPILRSRQPGASSKDLEKGEGRGEELAALTSQFILRRTIDILAQYLPPKTEYVLFCRPTTSQATVYTTVLRSSLFGSIIGSSEASLQLIDILKKLCNSPSLLRTKEVTNTSSTSTSLISSLLTEIPPSLLKSPGASGKLQVLDSLLHMIRKSTLEKVVIVSHYTSTLDIIANLLNSLTYSWLRLDGSTPSGKRQELVDRFNRTDANKCFAFLLSAKSGGVGLNLTGASRLILFDVDWNPSADLQAMARIHRDGQKRPCRIYRLLTQGTLDEKIYQRQLTKLSLADSVIDNKEYSAGFTRDELRDLFRLDTSPICKTHELSQCQCDGTGAAHDTGLSEDNSDTGLESDDGKDANEAYDDIIESRYPKPIKASQLDINSLQKQVNDASSRRVEKAKIMGVMQYRHLDPAVFLLPPPPSSSSSASIFAPSPMDSTETTPFIDATSEPIYAGDDTTRSKVEDMEVVLDDDVLVNVLLEKENRINYVFTKFFSAPITSSSPPS